MRPRGARFTARPLTQMRRLLILLAAGVLALGALPSPAQADLFVASEDNSTVLRYHDGTGAFIDAFVAAGSGGLSTPTFLVFRSPASSAPIPTLSESGVIGMGMLLAGMGVWAMRRPPRSFLGPGLET
jgi:hypothetical protein